MDELYIVVIAHSSFEASQTKNIIGTRILVIDCTWI